MRASFGAQLERVTHLTNPIWVALQVCAVHGAAAGFGGGDIGPDTRSLHQRDYAQHADAFMAAGEAINATPDGAGRVSGLLHWGFWFTDRFTQGLVPGDAAFDMMGSVRGKPAEAVLTWWWKRW